MKRFRCCELVFLFYVLHLIIQQSCQKETQPKGNHVKGSTGYWKSGRSEKKKIPVGNLNTKRTLRQKDGESKVDSKEISSTAYFDKKRQSLNKEAKNDLKHTLNSHVVTKAYNNRSATEHKITESVQHKNVTQPSKSARKGDSNKQKHKKKKKKIFKKYGLVQSFNPVREQLEEYQPVMVGGGAPSEGYATELGATQGQSVAEQDQQAQQQQAIDMGNPFSQYSTAQDNEYQQENSQQSVASFAPHGSEEADGTQPDKLEQAVQMQQEAYTQPQEQSEEQMNTGSESQVGEVEGQGGQVVEGGQVQFQTEQAAQGQEQVIEEGQQQSPGDQTGLSRDSFHQEQPQDFYQQPAPQEIEQQAPVFGEQQQLQQQDQSQEYQQQQQSEESQENEGPPVEAQGLSTSSSSYSTLFGTEGQQSMGEQRGQSMASYTSEQGNEEGEKNEAPAGTHYASSIEEALKEPSGFPQEANSEATQNQESINPSENTNVINFSPTATSNSNEGGGGNHEYMEGGTISSPSGYSTAALDDNDNSNQPETNPEVNGYAQMNGPTLNNEDSGFPGLEGMQQSQGGSLTDASAMYNFGGGPPFHQQGSGSKIPPMDEEFYKIINIANKHGPTAVKGCKGCPPHASCIDKVCIINDDQPLAHILSALSGPEPDEEPSKVDCNECHYNAKCEKTGCVCKPGYTGDGQDCRPDTCLPGCKQHGKCIKGFCLCDHHHYFNGYECAPYKIKHKNCPLDCTASCHPDCPANCCKHHPVLKIHFNDGSFHPPSSSAPGKNTTTSPPQMVVLKPEEKQEEHIANYASDFEKRPDDLETVDLQTVDLKHPAEGFSVSDMEAKPLIEEDCPGPCKTECRESCPVRCCLRKCPINCMESCKPSCPKRCCYLPGVKNLFPMMDPRVQENFMGVMVQKFCPGACKNKCNANCPPICCKRSSSLMVPSSGDVPGHNREGKNSDDFFRNAMSWFGMMNFLNMMYNMYGNLYANKPSQGLPHIPGKASGHTRNALHPPKPKTTITESHLRFQEVGVAEGPRKDDFQCPHYCNKSCLHICPAKCCGAKLVESSVVAKTRCQPSCKWFCSNSCPAGCCSKLNGIQTAQHHPTVPFATTKISALPISPPAPAPAKPPAACTPGCPAYCYPQCQENCCRRGDLPTFKHNADKNIESSKGLQSQQPYNNFFANAPPPFQQGCPAICEHHCGPSCPFRCCGHVPTSSSHTSIPPAGSPNAPECPGNCASECFPACTMTCCNAGLALHGIRSDPPHAPTVRPKEPASPNTPLTFQHSEATCHPGCSNACYPSCDEVCCRASLDQGKSNQEKEVSHYTIKVPCPSECRPYNCLYYCHHDCCLQSKRTVQSPRMIINRPYGARSMPRRTKKSFREKNRAIMSSSKTEDVPITKRFENVNKENKRKMTRRHNRRTLKLKTSHLPS